MTRKEYIIHAIRDKSKITVEELCETLNVSNITIRRDLSQLENEGFLSRVHGGATLPFGDNSSHKRISSKARDHILEKKRIAKKLDFFISNDATIFVNGGSTTIACLEEITATHIQVFTNNALATASTHNATTTVQFLGGILDPFSKTFYGDIPLYNLENIKADYCVLGTNAIHLENGISSFFFHEVALNKKMIKHTIGKVILVADHSKMNLISNYKISDLSDIDILITGKECPTSFCEQLERLFNIDVYLV